MSGVTGVYDDGYVSLSDKLREVGKPKLPQPEAGAAKASVSKCGRVTTLPKQFLCDQQWMLFVVLFFGVVTQSFNLAGGDLARYVPYLSIASSPFYLVHAIRSTMKNFKMVGEAGKAQRVAETLFYLLAGVSSFGTAFGDIAKPLSSGVEIAGLTHTGACGLIFGKILPIVMIVTGGISGSAAAAKMLRAHGDLRKFKQKLKDPSFQRLVEAFDFVYKERKERVDEERRVQHFVSDHPLRAEAIRARLKAHQFTYSCPLKEVEKPKVDEKIPQNDQALLNQIGALLHDVLAEKARPKNVLRMIEAIEETLELGEFKDIEEFRQALREQKEEVRKLQEGYELMEEVRAELNRKIAEHVIALFFAVLCVTAGIISTLHLPHYQLTSSILVITACMGGMGNVLFDKFVTHKQYLKVDRWIHGRLQESA